jgi:hypothetical protein
MVEPDLPVRFTFKNHQESAKLVDSLEQASEQVIWEQRVQEDGSVVVTILNIISLDEKAEQEDLE